MYGRMDGGFKVYISNVRYIHDSFIRPLTKEKRGIVSDREGKIFQQYSDKNPPIFSLEPKLEQLNSKQLFPNGRTPSLPWKLLPQTEIHALKLKPSPCPSQKPSKVHFPTPNRLPITYARAIILPSDIINGEGAKLQCNPIGLLQLTSTAPEGFNRAGGPSPWGQENEGCFEFPH